MSGPLEEATLAVQRHMRGSPIEGLPLEIRVEIIRHCPDLAAIRSATLSCPALRDAYESIKHRIPWQYQIFKGEISRLRLEEDVYRESVLFEVSHGAWKDRKNDYAVWQMCLHQVYGTAVPIPADWDSDGSLAAQNSRERILSVFRMVDFFSQKFLVRNPDGKERAATTWSLSADDYKFVAKLSRDEFVKAVYRAFYHIQCISTMYTVNRSRGPPRFCHGNVSCFFDAQSRSNQMFVTMAYDFIGNVICDRLGKGDMIWPTWASEIDRDAWKTVPLNNYLHYFYSNELDFTYKFLRGPLDRSSGVLLPRTARPSHLLLRKYLWAMLHEYKKYWGESGLESSHRASDSDEDEE
ncbi:hypothetical protein P152DRAFT_449333 [Eremomyces bilateralis CBS 781.70]|uniref:F-box domain-containing protein n=1 Tax=Eremomyces bilateralis CBS 781.70 TaxID=1392243 RepID=A0A6G1G3W0_9PEZI|nr:uncharacterized protein P152DRAFT_449333 [Eremomyces bilateralis CBS 781.70]KAF1812621.1 hypothetical protein P152DRAFT_449333 [Eremomyces bilateralis CBS 781.70]